MTAPLHTGPRTATAGCDWSAWDTAGRLVVTDAWMLERARDVVEHELAVLGGIVRSRAAARRTFRDGGWAARRHPLSPFPYGLTSGTPDAPPHLSLPPPARRTGILRRPRGELRLGHGPSLRAWTAQRCAEAVAAETMCGALVAIGADVATSGLAPVGGWCLELPGGALAIDGGALSWIDVSRGDGLRDLTVAATGRSVHAHWRAVAVVAANGPAASAACAGALLRGAAAPEWIAGLGLAARLTEPGGTVRDVGRWPGRARERTFPSDTRT